MSAALEIVRDWKNDPVKFAEDVFGYSRDITQPDHMDMWQSLTIEKIPKTNRLCLKACKNPGKTFVLGILAWWWLATRPHCKVVATSITSDNLADGLWTEMAKLQKRSKLLKNAFTWKKESITMNEHPETWYMVARAWSKSATQEQQESTLAGKHADYMLFILDEVGDIPDAVMVAADAALGSGIESKIIIAGNPTRLEGPLYRACTKARRLWEVVDITGDPDDPHRAPRVSIDWARDAIEQWGGRNNPWVMANVLGQFPPSSINALLGPDDVRHAMSVRYRQGVYAHSQKRIGVDVAREGNDMTVLMPRQGMRAFVPIMMRNADAPHVASRLIAGKDKWGSEMELVDATGGWGGAVCDFLVQAGATPIPIKFSSKADDDRFLNKRAEMWWRMAEWVKKGGWLPDIPQLAAELTAPTYTHINGRFALEEKKIIKKRLGFSPDIADALALTFALPDMPASRIEYDGTKSTSSVVAAKIDWNPLEQGW